MRRVIVIGFCLFTLTLFTAIKPSISLARETATKQRLVLNNIHWPPYLFKTRNTRYPGFATEILSGCYNTLGYRPEYIDLPVKRTHFYMKSGELDISIYSFKPERAQFVFYAKIPIFTSEYGFVVAKDSDIQIDKLDDLANYRIGHLAGLSHTPELIEIIEQKKPKQQVVEGNNVDLMLQQLISSPPRIDIIPNSKETFYWRIQEQNLDNELAVLDFSIAEKAYYVTVSKSSNNIGDPQAFLNAIDSCILRAKETGVYTQVRKKYGFR